MWNLIDKFLDDIASDTGYERESLSLVADLCGHGGPTIQPTQRPNKIIKSVTAGPSVTLPSGWYDSIGSNHLDYRVIRTEAQGKIEVPTVMYSFQHHPLAGSCRMGIQRWVRCHDPKWSDEMQLKALKFRVAVAKHHKCGILVVSSGPSGQGKTGELYDQFEELMSIGDGKQRLYGIRT